MIRGGYNVGPAALKELAGKLNHLLKIRSLLIGLKQYTSVVKMEAVQGLRRPTAYGLSNCHQKPHRQIHHHGHGRQNGSSTPGPRHKASGRVPLFHPAASTTRGVDRARYRRDAEVRAKQIGDRPKRDPRFIEACGRAVLTVAGGWLPLHPL